MSQTSVRFSVFTKPWKTLLLPELASKVSRMGFDGVELPVRPGFQVTPEHVGRDLPVAVKMLADHGLKIESVAGPTDEPTMAACAELGIPIIRICVGIEPEGYMATEVALQREYDALVPLLAKYGVTLGIQNHCGQSVSNAMGLRHLIEKYDPKQVAAVWDAAHNALDGEEPELAVDIVWSLLCMVNLKNAFWQRANGPEAEVAAWQPYWTSGRQGLASWPRVAAELKRREYKGVVCLTAEYTDEESVDRLIAEDIAFAKSLFA
ncbi:MAG TPA: sugar phosphate isomerase/epimerase family protein [Chthonomonadaceae bacterium]|nr:sugar phosphate isomerase/epimerase family protein [Chthonomonadaceae bacterium]